MQYKYGLKKINENMAKAVGRNLSISTKKAIEICNFIRGKNLNKAKATLTRVIEKKQAVPMKKFNDSAAHKPGIGPGKYPIKTAKEFLMILKSVESNALNKGLNTHYLYLTHIRANKASTPWHYGRLRRRKMKRTHVEIIVAEKKQNIEKEDTKNKK